ncbi:TPA: hypothetical protein ACU6IV_003520 [Pseudomonas aeruginosa]
MSLVLGRILASLFFALPKVANDELKPLLGAFFWAKKNQLIAGSFFYSVV